MNVESCPFIHLIYVFSSSVILTAGYVSSSPLNPSPADSGGSGGALPGPGHTEVPPVRRDPQDGAQPDPAAEHGTSR